MIAFATVLSMLKVVDMPYGGSVTAASTLPIAIISYRHGLGVGLMSGVVYATIQQLLGLSTLSYVTGWKSVVAVILLDYILAFAIIGLGGIFRGKLRAFSLSEPKRQSAELGIGIASVCILRYICHTVAGATVWAGLSIPSKAALIYSIGYNATYMIPETIVTTLAAVWLGSVIDFSRKNPERFTQTSQNCEAKHNTYELFAHISSLIFALTVALDVVLIAPHLQNEVSGEFDFSSISSAPWIAIAIISAIGCVSVVTLLLAKRIMSAKTKM